MLSKAHQAALNLGEARVLRDAGIPYRQIARRLKLSAGQLASVRRALKREKAARTRLARSSCNATVRDLPIRQAALPMDLRLRLAAAGLTTLGALADRIADPQRAGLRAIPGIGPHRVLLVEALLDHYGLRVGSDDLQAAVETLFPELRTP